MKNTIINFGALAGFNSVEVKDIDIDEIKDDLVTVVVDTMSDEDGSKLYRSVMTLLKNNTRVLLIGIIDKTGEDENGNSWFKAIASLMIAYNAYDIYKVYKKDVITSEYINKIAERKPDFSEAQTYIGGEETAYSDMTTILFGIESLVEEGKTEELNTFLENHMASIENLVTTMNSMRAICNTFNSGELTDTINSLKEKIEKLNGTISEKDDTISNIKHSKEEYQVKVEELQRENTKLKSSNEELKVQSESGGAVIQSYKELHLNSIQYTVQRIIYIKEINYVPYVNSLVMQLMAFLKLKRIKSKLVIYDTNTEMNKIYGKLNVVTGNDYASKKSVVLDKSPSFVVAEPVPIILEDLVTINPGIDVIVIYDRMKSFNKIISGNNVTEFYVIGSKSIYDNVSANLKIADTSNIISIPGTTIANNTIDIMTIDGYSSLTDSAKTQTYLRLKIKNTNEPLIKYIVSKSRIQID